MNFIFTSIVLPASRFKISLQISDEIANIHSRAFAIYSMMNSATAGTDGGSAQLTVGPECRGSLLTRAPDFNLELWR
jgi:hypothetical protein